jgi:hypothetical protein
MERFTTFWNTPNFPNTLCNLVYLRNKLNDAQLIMIEITVYTYINYLCILMNIQLSELKYTNLTYPHFQFMPILQRQHNLTQNHTVLWQILPAEMFKFSSFSRSLKIKINSHSCYWWSHFGQLLVQFTIITAESGGPYSKG